MDEIKQVAIEELVHCVVVLFAHQLPHLGYQHKKGPVYEWIEGLTDEETEEMVEKFISCIYEDEGDETGD